MPRTIPTISPFAQSGPIRRPQPERARLRYHRVGSPWAAGSRVSNWWLNLVWQDDQLDGRVRLVLAVLGDMADKRGRCWPSQRTLVARTHISGRMIRRIVPALEQAGYLAIRRKAGPKGVNIYQLLSARALNGEAPTISWGKVRPKHSILGNRPVSGQANAAPSGNRPLDGRLPQIEPATSEPATGHIEPSTGHIVADKPITDPPTRTCRASPDQSVQEPEKTRRGDDADYERLIRTRQAQVNRNIAGRSGSEIGTTVTRIAKKRKPAKAREYGRVPEGQQRLSVDLFHRIAPEIEPVKATKLAMLAPHDVIGRVLRLYQRDRATVKNPPAWIRQAIAEGWAES